MKVAYRRRSPEPQGSSCLLGISINTLPPLTSAAPLHCWRGWGRRVTVGFIPTIASGLGNMEVVYKAVT